MAPEQHEGLEPDPRSDQFSFCVSLWEAVYGSRPFRGRTPAELYQHAAAGPPVPPIGRTIPPRLRRTILRGLAPDPVARFPSIEALTEELRALRTRRRWWTAAAVGVSVSLATTLGLFAAARQTGLLGGAVEEPCMDAAGAAAGGLGTTSDATRSSTCSSPPIRARAAPTRSASRSPSGSGRRRGPTRGPRRVATRGSGATRPRTPSTSGCAASIVGSARSMPCSRVDHADVRGDRRCPGCLLRSERARSVPPRAWVTRCLRRRSSPSAPIDWTRCRRSPTGPGRCGSPGA